MFSTEVPTVLLLYLPHCTLNTRLAALVQLDIAKFIPIFLPWFTTET